MCSYGETDNGHRICSCPLSLVWPEHVNKMNKNNEIYSFIQASFEKQKPNYHGCSTDLKENSNSFKTGSSKLVNIQTSFKGNFTDFHH